MERHHEDSTTEYANVLWVVLEISVVGVGRCVVTASALPGLLGWLICFVAIYFASRLHHWMMSSGMPSKTEMRQRSPYALPAYEMLSLAYFLLIALTGYAVGSSPEALYSFLCAQAVLMAAVLLGALAIRYVNR